MSSKERLADVLEAILDRLDGIEVKQQEIVNVLVSDNRDLQDNVAATDRLRRDFEGFKIQLGPLLRQ